MRAHSRLKNLLNSGLSLVDRRNLYTTPEIPKADEPGYRSFSHSMSEHMHQNGLPKDFESITKSITAIFKEEHLNHERFLLKTSPPNDNLRDSSAKQLKRQLYELDRIVHEPKYIESYVRKNLEYPVEFKDLVVHQGYKDHKFRDPIHAQVINFLWDTRQIVTKEGAVISKGSPTSRDDLLQNLDIDWGRFTDIARGIHQSMKRKEILLHIAYPDHVQLIATQEFV